MTRQVDTGILRPTRAIVDLDVLAANVAVFRRMVPEPVRLMAVVKANGYGHGATTVARTALEAGATDLAVATVDEGAQLRRRGVVAPILVLGAIGQGEVDRALSHGLSLAVASAVMVDRVAERAECGGQDAARLHLKIDTGMRRFGCLPDESVSLARRVAADGRLRLDGVFTHFACADEADERPTAEQAAVFDRCLHEIERELGAREFIRHAANSAATLRSRRYDYDMVRLGIAMYGAAPSDDVPLAEGLAAPMAIESTIAHVIELDVGDRVSYGGTYAAQGRERAALVPIGYADGYRRALSSRAWMGAGGEAAPVRGRVSMDQTIIGLPTAIEACVGDAVIVVGTPESGAPTWSELAALSGTIAYEMMTGISARVPRVYRRNGDVFDVEVLDGSAVSLD